MNSMTGYIASYDLVERQTSTHARVVRGKLQYKHVHTETRRSFKTATDGESSSVSMTESKSGSIYSAEQTAMVRQKTFFSTSAEYVGGGEIRNDKVECIDPQDIRTTSLFDQLSGVEKSKVLEGNATPLQSKTTASKTGAAMTYSGGASLALTNPYAGLATTLLGVFFQAKADVSDPTKPVELHKSSESEKLNARID